MDLAQRGMGAALAGLRRLAGLSVIDRLGMRDAVEAAVHRIARDGFRAAAATSRAFGQVAERLERPARQRHREPAPLFDLTPTDEQEMLQQAFRQFADQRLRPAARQADDACAPPAEILDQATELGTLILGVPSELGGVVDERASVTAVLAAEALAHGDLGLAAACLAPGAVATALALWGDAEQQGTYLSAFTGEDPPVAALAVQEPRALFDPFDLRTRARRDGGDLVLEGVKSLVPRGADAELFLVAADLDGAPALVIVESGAGITVEPEPAMGARATAAARVHLDEVRVPADAVLAGGDPAAYAEAVHRARLAWCALAVGTSQAVLEYVVPYVNEREAFGEPISHRQSVAFMVSDIAIELEGMRLATYRAASRADQGKTIVQSTAAARQLCAAKAMDIGSAGVQLLGGHGYVKEHPVERWYRDLRVAGLAEGVLLV